MVRVLSDDEVASVLSLSDLLPVVEEAFVRQGRGEVERPERPHFPVGTGPDDPGEPAGTALVMPAYLHGADRYATKLAAVHESNPPERPSVHAQIALTDARTGEPVAYVAGTRITNARTSCVGGLAARDLAAETPATLGVLGAGTQARWQARAIDAAIGVDAARIYSPSDSRDDCAADLRERGIDARAVASPREAVEGAAVVVTATTSREPVFPADALGDGALVVAVGAYTAEMQELEPAVFDRAARVFADVPGEVAEVGDLRATGLAAEELVPLAEVFEGGETPGASGASGERSRPRARAGRGTDGEVIVVESVGTAVLDAAAADHVYERALASGVGTDVTL